MEKQEEKIITREELIEKIKNNSVVIPEGEFLMGSEDQFCKDAKPVHEVFINSFRMYDFPVTNEDYKNFCKETGHRYPEFIGDAKFNNPLQPVVGINYEDSEDYIKWLNEKTGLEFRLPTEAEWEYACQAGSTSRYWWGDEEPEKTVLNFDYNFHSTNEKGKYKPNKFGLYDMLGNIKEWCSDWYDETYYAITPRDNPKGPDTGTFRVIRGGYWMAKWAYLASAFRDKDHPLGQNLYTGFRLVGPVDIKK